MTDKINLLNNNSNRDWSDLEWIDEFYEFLQGEVPDEITLSSHNKPKLTQKKAFAIIWYLQEHFPLLPDQIEMCGNCGNLFDSDSGGIYWESRGKSYCDSCEYLVPENYDRGKR